MTVMTREVLERISICLEVLAFFVAAPDFLGETTLAALTDKIEHKMGLCGGKLDEVAQRLLKRFFDVMALGTLPGNAPSVAPPEAETGKHAGPSGRIGFILIAIALDTWVVLWVRYHYHGIPSLLQITTSLNPLAGVSILIFTLVGFVYFLQLFLEGALAIVKRSGAKGLFFAIGAAIFVCAKGLAFCAAGIEDLPHAEARNVGAIAPVANNSMAVAFWTYLQPLSDWIHTVVSGLEPKDYLSLGVGGIGLLLSLAIWIRTIRRERRHLEVKVSQAFFTYANGEISTQMASIDVINRGSRPAYVKAPTLRTPDKKYLTFVGVPDFKKFPRRLDDGESASLCVTYAEIANTLKKQGKKGAVTVWPSCLDATNKRYWGKKWKLDIDKDWIGK